MTQSAIQQHEIQYERLNEPWKNRIDYVAKKKPWEERAWRFRVMRPLPQLPPFLKP